MNKFLALALGLGILTLSWFRPDPAHAQQWLPGGTGSPIVCVFNNSPPTVGTGLFIYAQCDTNGKLITSGGGGGGGAITAPLGPQTAAASVATTINGTLPAFAAPPAFTLSGTLPAFAATPTFNGASNVTPTQCDGSIATGGAAQTPITAQTTLHGFTITNNDPTHGSGEPLWISMTAVAVLSAGTGSNPLPAPATTTLAGMGSYSSPPGFGVNHAISVIAATTGHTFGCFWW